MWRGTKAGSHGTTRDDAVAPAVFDCPPAPPSFRSDRIAVPGSAGADIEERLVGLRRGLDDFRISHTDSVLSAGRAINPLLDLWGLAAAVDRSVAAPIEALLTVLVSRTSTTSAELGACADEVEASLTRL
jgi:hypothetical protein